MSAVALGTSLAFYVLAGFAEIAGCFAFWTWLRLGGSAWWALPGMVSLALFAFFLTRVQLQMAGRAYAAYGGIYILCSVLWLWAVEGASPDAWDWLGVGLALAGALTILAGHRGA